MGNHPSAEPTRDSISYNTGGENPLFFRLSEQTVHSAVSKRVRTLRGDLAESHFAKFPARVAALRDVRYPKTN